MVEYHPISAKDKSRLTNLVRKSYQEYSLDVRCMRGEFRKEIFLVAHIEELQNMDESEIYLRRITAKEVVTPQRVKIS